MSGPVAGEIFKVLTLMHLSRWVSCWFFVNFVKVFYYFPAYFVADFCVTFHEYVCMFVLDWYGNCGSSSLCPRVGCCGFFGSLY